MCTTPQIGVTGVSARGYLAWLVVLVGAEICAVHVGMTSTASYQSALLQHIGS